MLEQILDLHIHSKYARACSKRLDLPTIAAACEERGVDIVSTGDFTHPEWFAHIKEELQEVNSGIYELTGKRSPTKFILGTELAVIKKDKGKTRRVHHCVYVPNIAVLEKLNKTLASDGFNLRADGRPILGLTSHDLLAYLLDIDERIELIPAHAWTPWFGVFGSKGGYTNLDDAFGDLAPHIQAIETGLSSDPVMNRMCSWLDDITLVSNSDAHSPEKLGREANVLQFEKETNITYDEIFRIINEGDKNNFHATIEFYPEEGKYHSDGHRDCDIRCTPEETKKYKEICPTCSKKLTVGVLYRVHELADRTEAEAKKFLTKKSAISYESIVPLTEILSEVYDVGVKTKTVNRAYTALLSALGSEFYILRKAPIGDIVKVAKNSQVAEAVNRVRNGNIVIQPGYDGVFGIVQIFSNEERKNWK